MKKIFILLLSVAFSTFLTTAQNPQSFETTANLDKKTSGSCVSVKVNIDAKTAQSLMDALLKKENLKGGKTKGKTILYSDPIMASFLGPNYINLYFSFDVISKDKNAPITAVNMFVTNGAGAPFVNSTTDPALIANMKSFLDQKYVEAVVNNNILMRQTDKQKEIGKASKELEKQKKHVEKRTKDIKSYEKDIEKANKTIQTSNSNIEKAKSEIEQSKKEIDAKQQVLSNLQNELKQIK